MIVGYKGKTPSESGIIYAPYIPITFKMPMIIGDKNVLIKFNQTTLKTLVTFRYQVAKDEFEETTLINHGHFGIIDDKELVTKEEARTIWDELVKKGFVVYGN